MRRHFAYGAAVTAWALTLLFLASLLAAWAYVAVQRPVEWQGQPGTYVTT